MLVHSKGKAYSKIAFLQKGASAFFTGPRKRKGPFVSTSEETDTLKKKKNQSYKNKKILHTTQDNHKATYVILKLKEIIYLISHKNQNYFQKMG